MVVPIRISFELFYKETCEDEKVKSCASMVHPLVLDRMTEEVCMDKSMSSVPVKRIMASAFVEWDPIVKPDKLLTEELYDKTPLALAAV